MRWQAGRKALQIIRHSTTVFFRTRERTKNTISIYKSRLSAPRADSRDL